MKKLRMIVTSVIVFTIVGSSFAYKAKVNVFCVDNKAVTDGNCNSIYTNRKIDPNSLTAINYYSCWSGLQSECTGHHCTSTVKVTIPD